MFEQHLKSSKAIALPRTITVVVQAKHERYGQEEAIAEINELAISAQLDVLITYPTTLRVTKAATYLPEGKLTAISDLIKKFKCDMVVFDCDITMTQSRNLEKFLGVHVLDRTGLILTVFSLRAKSHEGKLQVELAMYRRQLGRLSGLWTHLERQRGGIGLRGGPGEKQIEIDRRLLSIKVKRLEKQIDKMMQRNQLARQRRRKNGIPSVAVVGYTNAGKSTLFNLLAGESIPANDRLFDTLDTTSRRVHIGNGEHYILSDTVGFIRNLPHTLIAGFRATLQDTADSDILIIVVDSSHVEWQSRLDLVFNQMQAIGAENQDCIIIHNKIDKNGLSPKVDHSDCGRMTHIHMSCFTSNGVDLLVGVLTKKIRLLLSAQTR